MEDKVYYIKGSAENPEGVEQALLEVCPNPKNNYAYSYSVDKGYYYVINNLIGYDDTVSVIHLLERFGTELQPKSIEEKPVQFRLPTKEEFEDLLKHFSKWNEKEESWEFLSREGWTLKLPVTGYYLNDTNNNTDTHGYYWSSTKDEDNNNFAYNFYFNSNSRGMAISNHSCYKHSVRLISSTPFKDAVEFNGVYWKPENEPGYFTFDEAIERFNKPAVPQATYSPTYSHWLFEEQPQVTDTSIDGSENDSENIKSEKLVEKIMYSSVYEFDEDGVLEQGGRLFSTKEEALADADSVGCQEVKIIVKE